MVQKVNGGVSATQNVAGKLHFFKILAAVDFGYTVSDGTITIEPVMSGRGVLIPEYSLVNVGESVPNSIAEHIVRVLQDKCTIVQINTVEVADRTTEIHLAVEGAAFGWIDGTGAVDTSAMQTAIQALGTVTVPNTHGGSVGDLTIAPVTEDIDVSAATITSSAFVLA